MKYRKILTNFLLFFISTSLFILSFSLAFELSIISKGLEIEKKRKFEVDYPAKLKSVLNGLLPVYFPSVTRSNFINSKYYPIGTLPYTPTFHCNEGYGLVSYISDRFGLRNKDQKWDLIKEKGATFFVGDSFTQGACVDNEFRFTEIFSNLLNANTLNLGTGGNGPYEYIALLRNVVKPIISSFRGKDFNVILVFYANDNEMFDKSLDLHLNKTKTIASIKSDGTINVSKEYISVFNETLKKHHPTSKEEISNELKSNFKKMKKPKFIGSFGYKVLTLSQIRQRLKRIKITNKKTENSPSYKAIKELSIICNSKSSCTPYVAYIANSDYWRPNPHNNDYRLYLEKIASKLSVKYLDGTKVINHQDKNNYAPKGSHLSKTGNKKFADFLASQVKK